MNEKIAIVQFIAFNDPRGFGSDVLEYDLFFDHQLSKARKPAIILDDNDVTMLTAWNSYKKARRTNHGALTWRHWALLVLLAMVLAWLGMRFIRGEAGAPADKRSKIAQITAGDELRPTRLAVLVFKSERKVEVWAMRASSERWTQLREYPILASSGTAGPKLRNGDKQVPEGVYELKPPESKAPIGRTFELKFPNDFDTRCARADGRMKLAGSVAITGKDSLAGCVSIGDEALQDLGGLLESVPIENVRVILAPNDLRRRIPVRNPNLKLPWIDELYSNLKRELAVFVQDSAR